MEAQPALPRRSRRQLHSRALGRNQRALRAEQHPVNATGEKIRDDGLWCVYEFTWQMDAILFWARFEGRWLRGSEFHYPERPKDLQSMIPLENWPKFDPRNARSAVCNLYNTTTNQAAIIALFRVVNRYIGNLPPMPGVFPNYPAPVVRNAGAERELTMMRWGMPPPPKFGGPPVTNIRNTSSPHWRGWLRPESRCLVPANSFSEYAPEANPETGKKDVVWFALNGVAVYLCRFRGT
jgi:hypothetical protein